VIGADGALSRVAQAAGLVHPAEALWGFALRGYVERDVPRGRIDIFSPPGRPPVPGYGWAFPSSGGGTNVGVGLGLGLRDRRDRGKLGAGLLADYLRLVWGEAAPELIDRRGGWLRMGLGGVTLARGGVADGPGARPGAGRRRVDGGQRPARRRADRAGARGRGVIRGGDSRGHGLQPAPEVDRRARRRRSGRSRRPGRQRRLSAGERRPAPERLGRCRAPPERVAVAQRLTPLDIGAGAERGGAHPLMGRRPRERKLR
jgi:hypothetical protein